MTDKEAMQALLDGKQLLLCNGATAGLNEGAVVCDDGGTFCLDKVDRVCPENKFGQDSSNHFTFGQDVRIRWRMYKVEYPNGGVCFVMAQSKRDAISQACCDTAIHEEECLVHVIPFRVRGWSSDTF